MKKLIAGVVMTGLLFMAMATGAFARSGNGGANGQTNGGQSCTKYEYNFNTYCTRHGNW